MGYIHSEFKLTNYENKNTGTFTFLLDSKFPMLCINEVIQNELGFDEISTREFCIDGVRQTLKVVGTVILEFDNRTSMTSAIVLPANAEPLFCKAILNMLDLTINMKEEKVILPPERPYKRVIRV